MNSLLRKKKNQELAGLLFGFLILFGVGYFFVTRAVVPPNFNQTRQDAAAVAREIVALTEESIKNLDKIALEDRRYNFKKALELVREELERSKNSRQKAIDLTQALDKMAKTAVEIRPAKARNLVVDAIRGEVSLVTHLIVFNDALNGLLQTLEYKFSGDIRYDADDVQKLIQNMNKEAQEINSKGKNRAL